MREKGKFWPKVRAIIWLKAQELYQKKQAKTMGEDFTGMSATKKELLEGGYFEAAKLIILRDLYRKKFSEVNVNE